MWRMTGTRVAAPGRLTIRRRTARCMTIRRTGRLPVVGTTGLVPAAGEAAGALATAGATSLGTTRTGNRAAGTTTSGTGATVAGGLTNDLTEATNRLLYGTARAASPRMPNQNRFRRDPNTPQPAERRNPPYEGPAYAGLVLNQSRVPSGSFARALQKMPTESLPHTDLRPRPRTFLRLGLPVAEGGKIADRYDAVNRNAAFCPNSDY